MGSNENEQKYFNSFSLTCRSGVNPITISPLLQNKGYQRYLIAERVEVESFESVAIWYRQFNATFGAATLEM